MVAAPGAQAPGPCRGRGGGHLEANIGYGMRWRHRRSAGREDRVREHRSMIAGSRTYTLISASGSPALRALTHARQSSRER